ncbi:hypothetical protein, conserved [Babesia ovata]|uniref:Uncharacterized protein n=1 Tax=Babesia ovata TaxID=189622 RepID=A0A2H6K968_9APIC|nr:uncharacterized protein BOVATA_010230 [Babesia ovata]GBE59530.1 hypothetical protein, conserved [Babesia ovata]
MAPKKLTDCPENLRESIDWLIQVRHGGDGRGLDQLAEALKKLIEGAIENANVSIKTEHDKFKGLVKSDPSKQKALDEIEERQHKLAELSGQLAQFIGTSEAIKEAIKNSFSIYLDRLSKLLDPSKYYACCKSKNKLKFDELKRLQDKLMNSEKLETIVSEINFKALLKPLEYNNDTCTHHHYKDSTTNEALKDVESKLESLAKLGDSLDKFNNEPNTILTNLCSGLEIFLGFSQETKGYNGTGIVYSDLDRLCDAVMAFVLHCLKGSEGLLTFYNPKIPSIISELSAVTGKGSGVKGFAEAIESVRQGLEGYESGMTSKSKKVVEDVTTIQSNFTSLREYLENTNNKNLQAQLQQVQEKSRLYWVKASLAEEARKALDPALSGKLDKHVSLGVHAADTFKKIAFNPEVIKAAKAVDDGLKSQKQNIDTAIEQGITDVQKTLNSGFDGIKQKLESLYQKKDEQFTSVNESIKDAKMLVSELLAKDAKKFNDQYRDYIIAKFESLKLSAAALKVDPNPGTQCQLEKEVNAVKQAVEEIEIAYQKKLRDVKMKVDLAVNQAVSRLQTVDTAVKNGLKHVREQIKIQLQGFLQHVWTAVELGMQRAAVGDIYAPTSGVMGLATGFQGAQLDKLESRFREVGQGSSGLAKKIQTVLSDLNLVKDDKSGTPTGDVLFEQLGGDIKAALENQLKDVIKDEISLIDLTTLMNAYYKETVEHGEHVRLRGLINLIKVPVSKDGFTGDGVTAGFKPVEMDGYTHKQVRSHDNEGVKSNYYRALQKVVNNINNLESLPGAIEDARKAAEKRMELLKGEIKGIETRIDKVEEVVESADYQLTEDINNISMAYNDAEQKSRHTINQLHNQLTNVVREAFSTLTHQVQSLFAKQKQAELAQLQNVVTAQLREIQRVIAEDKKTGVKGFLGKMKEGIDDQFSLPSNSEELIKNITFKNMATGAQKALGLCLDYVIEQMSPPDKPADSHLGDVEGISQRFDELLNYLKKPNDNNRKYNFDNTFSKSLDALNKSLSTFNPSRFENGKNPLLFDLLMDGMKALVEQLQYAYVNAYSEQTVKWKNTKLPDALALDDDELTENAIKCSNVFCSIISTLYNELSQLREDCKTGGNCEKKKIDLNNLLTFSTSGPTKTDTNPLGHFLKRCGFRVASLPDASNAELNNKPTMMGSHIFQLLVGHGRVFSRQDPDDDKSGDQSPVYKLLKHLHDYYKTCHLQYISSTKYPFTVRDMLHWLCGLWHNPVLGNVEQYFKTLFRKPKQYENTDYSAIPDYALKVEGTSNIQPYDLSTELYKVCSHAEKVLITILGYGDANGRYSCDFNTNPDDLSYPTNAGECLDWLIEICMRLNRQLYFLYNQCCNGKSSSGWLDCWYGKHVGGSSWRCNDKQCPKQDCDQKADQHYKCGLKSPLQSFLEDGLQGFLPHTYNKADCNMTCSLPNHFETASNTRRNACVLSQSSQRVGRQW